MEFPTQIINFLNQSIKKLFTEFMKKLLKQNKTSIFSFHLYINQEISFSMTQIYKIIKRLMNINYEIILEMIPHII